MNTRSFVPTVVSLSLGLILWTSSAHGQQQTISQNWGMFQQTKGCAANPVPGAGVESDKCIGARAVYQSHPSSQFPTPAASDSGLSNTALSNAQTCCPSPLSDDTNYATQIASCENHFNSSFRDGAWHQLKTGRDEIVRQIDASRGTSGANVPANLLTQLYGHQALIGAHLAGVCAALKEKCMYISREVRNRNTNETIRSSMQSNSNQCSGLSESELTRTATNYTALSAGAEVARIETESVTEDGPTTGDETIDEDTQAEIEDKQKDNKTKKDSGGGFDPASLLSMVQPFLNQPQNVTIDCNLPENDNNPKCGPPKTTDSWNKGKGGYGEKSSTGEGGYNIAANPDIMNNLPLDVPPPVVAPPGMINPVPQQGGGGPPGGGATAPPSAGNTNAGGAGGPRINVDVLGQPKGASSIGGGSTDVADAGTGGMAPQGGELNDSSGMDLKKYLPGGSEYKGMNRMTASLTGNSQIQSQSANMWDRISDRIRSRCLQGLLRDCGTP